MPLGINPLVDFAFKMIFGTPENRDCLINLLNATLRPKEPIVEVTLDNPFNPKFQAKLERNPLRHLTFGVCGISCC